MSDFILYIIHLLFVFLFEETLENIIKVNVKSLLWPGYLDEVLNDIRMLLENCIGGANIFSY